MGLRVRFQFPVGRIFHRRLRRPKWTGCAKGANILGRSAWRSWGLDVDASWFGGKRLPPDTSVGTTQGMISSFAAVDAFARAGRVRRIALSSAKRFPGLDELPTIAESAAGLRTGRLAGRGRSGRHARGHRGAAEPAHRAIPAQPRDSAAAPCVGPCNQRHGYRRDHRPIHPSTAGAVALAGAGARPSAGMNDR
jgi:hypothetical protein